MITKEQTAVEWIESVIEEMIENGGDLGDDCPALLVHIKQAKAKEKKQISAAFSRGYDYCNDRELENKDDDFEYDYYDKTFGGENDN